MRAIHPKCVYLTHAQFIHLVAQSVAREPERVSGIRQFSVFSGQCVLNNLDLEFIRCVLKRLVFEINVSG